MSIQSLESDLINNQIVAGSGVPQGGPLTVDLDGGGVAITDLAMLEVTALQAELAEFDVSPNNPVIIVNDGADDTADADIGPNNLLHLQAPPGYGEIRIQVGTDTFDFGMADDGGEFPGAYFFNNSDTSTYFGTNGTARLYLLAAGNVLVNGDASDSSGAIFQVVGDSSFGGRIFDSSRSAGSAGKVLTTGTGSGVVWRGPSMQRSSPSTGSTVSVTGFGSAPAVALLLTPGAGLSALTIQADNGGFDGQMLTVTCSATITTITWGSNFAAGVTAIATANTGMRFIWDATASLWRQI